MALEGLNFAHTCYNTFKISLVTRHLRQPVRHEGDGTGRKGN